MGSEWGLHGQCMGGCMRGCMRDSWAVHEGLHGGCMGAVLIVGCSFNHAFFVAFQKAPMLVIKLALNINTALYCILLSLKAPIIYPQF